jgi:enoyl-CoA hydratase/carnithine racemase
MEDYREIQVEIKGRILEITLARPDRANSLTDDVWEELGHALSYNLEEDMAGVLLRGGEVFSTGWDLGVIQNWTIESALESLEKAETVMTLMEEAPQVVIAHVSGLALGAGADLVLGCDMIFSDRSGFFAWPEAALGLIPRRIEEMVAKVGLPRALGLFYGGQGQGLTGEKALEYGLITSLSDGNALSQILTSLEEASPSALKQIKKIARRKSSSGPETYAIRLTHPDSREGIQAFLEGRKPEWT